MTISVPQKCILVYGVENRLFGIVLWGLYCGDCMDILPTLPDRSIDMVLADLPYGLTACKWDSPLNLDSLWGQYKRLTKPTAAIVLTASQPFTSRLVMSKPDWFKHEWVWIKNRGSNFANTVREPFKEHESVLVFCQKSGWVYNKQMQERTGGGSDRVRYDLNSMTKSYNYHKFDKPQNPKQGAMRVPSSWQKFNTEVGLHPTQKPVSLMEYMIRTYTNEGDTVLDNTMGSGTTGGGLR